jgi:AcrR family transcriptional regulator
MRTVRTRLSRARDVESPERAAPRGYHHGSLRRALLDAAQTLIEREGPTALTLRAVARAADVSANAPYNHFADKSALLAAVAEEGLDVLFARMSEARRSKSKPAEQLAAIGIAYVEFALDHPARFRLLAAPEMGKKTTHPTLVTAYDRTFEVLVETMRACQKAGVVRSGDARAHALTAWSTVHGLATLIVEDQLEAAGFADDAASRRELASTVVRTIFRGLKA